MQFVALRYTFKQGVSAAGIVTDGERHNLVECGCRAYIESNCIPISRKQVSRKQGQNAANRSASRSGVGGGRFSHVPAYALLLS
jgi:hypothetical protein